MNGVQLRRKVARLQAEKAKHVERSLAVGVLESVHYATPGGFRKSDSGLHALFSAAGSILFVVALGGFLLLAASAFVRAAP